MKIAQQNIRTLKLLTMTAKAPLLRLRHDLGRELVVFASCFIFIGTFFYVFDDFLNVQLKALSLSLRSAVAFATLILIVLTTCSAVGWQLGKMQDDLRSTGSMADFLGEDPAVVRVFQRSWSVFVVFSTILLISAVAHFWLLPLSAQGFLSLLFSGSMISTLAYWTSKILFKPKTREHAPSDAIGNFLTPTQKHSLFLFQKKIPQKLEPVNVMVAFRIRQILPTKSTRSLVIRFSQITLVSSGPLAFALTGSLFLSGMGSLLGGLVFGSLFAGFIAQDLNQSWTERGLGITHDQYVKSLEHLTFHLLKIPFVLCFALMLTLHSASLGNAHAEWLKALISSFQVALIGALPLLSLPWTGLQIDGRKPAVPIMTTVIVGLFLGSAILAHPLAIFLVPILRSAALPYQNGRFYRS